MKNNTFNINLGQQKYIFGHHWLLLLSSPKQFCVRFHFRLTFTIYPACSPTEKKKSHLFYLWTWTLHVNEKSPAGADKYSLPFYRTSLVWQHSALRSLLSDLLSHTNNCLIIIIIILPLPCHSTAFGGLLYWKLCAPFGHDVTVAVNACWLRRYAVFAFWGNTQMHPHALRSYITRISPGRIYVFSATKCEQMKNLVSKLIYTLQNDIFVVRKSKMPPATHF